MNRAFYFLLIFACLTSPLTSAERPPNFVLIFVDDLGYADLACFGSPDIRTPRLDQLAAEGMKFTSFYAQPICGPSRAALMTGCHPLRLAEKGNIKEIHPVLHSKEITIAEILKTKGYATGCFGKWDLARHSQTDYVPNLMPNHQGFDTFFGTPTSNDRLVNLFRNEELIEKNTDMSVLTQRYTDEAIQFIDDHHEEPFFVYVPHTMPHTRLDASADFKGKSKRGLYGDVVEEIDFSAGRIIDTLKKHELTDNTYFLFTSDNGPWLSKNKNHEDGHLPGDQGGSAGNWRSGKVSTWEGGVRVPTILWAPGKVPAGTECNKLAATIDILPTFAKLAGAEAPTDRVIDGEDIQHLFAGNFEKATKDKVFRYYFLNTLQAVRQEKWKLHLPRPARPSWLGGFTNNRHIAPGDWIEMKTPFLVDLEADPGETKNVATENPMVVAHLLELAEDARVDIGDYNRVGENMRFFDPMEKRPEKPNFPSLRPRKPKAKPKAKAKAKK